MTDITINADVGESVGPSTFGAVPAVMEYVDWVNVGCLWRPSDPGGIDRAVAAAVPRGQRIGAHPGPQLMGGARRRLTVVTAEDVENQLLYQVGALTPFLKRHGAKLHHIKPHGFLYGILALDEELMRAAARVAAFFDVPLIGTAGTAHEAVCQEMGVPFIPELYVDLDYRSDGTVIMQRRPAPADPQLAAARIRSALSGDGVETIDGTRLDIRFESIALHADIAGVTALARAVRDVLADAARS